MRSGLAESVASDAATVEDTADSIQAEAINSYLAVEKRLHGGIQKHADLETQDTKLSVSALAVAPDPAPDRSFSGVSVTDVAAGNDAIDKLGAAPDAEPASSRCGRWSLDEKLMFLYGLSLFGKGRWKKIRAYVPNRYVKLTS